MQGVQHSAVGASCTAGPGRQTCLGVPARQPAGGRAVQQPDLLHTQPLPAARHHQHHLSQSLVYSRMLAWQVGDREAALAFLLLAAQHSSREAATLMEELRIWPLLCSLVSQGAYTIPWACADMQKFRRLFFAESTWRCCC